ncbi:MAG: Zn-dependent exopeptidase M28 [Candidatus Thermoplasmatota archaeon]|nr:Zn-dependent exopeptidase M28 [Candidatus Thermoplasmatota archaeon]
MSSSFIYTPQETEIETDSTVSKINQILTKIDQNKIEGYLTELVLFGPRMTGTYGCQKSGEYIANRFESFGLKTSLHNWTLFGNRFYPRWYNSFNVIGVHPGSDPNSNLEIVFTAHYDSVQVSPGADDDGSGVTAILAAASVLSKYEFNHTIRFVCFSGEEVGLLGSKAYVEMQYETIKDKIIINFNADGIGYATSETINTFRLWGTEDAIWLVNKLESLNNQYGLKFNIARRTLPEDRRGGSDYHSFVRYGFDSIAFFEGSWNPHWHTAEDTIEHMNLNYLTRTTQLITMGIAWLADETITYPYVYIESPNKGYLYFEGRQQKRLKDTQSQQIRTIVIDDIWIWAHVFLDDSLIEKVEFYVDDQLEHVDIEPPYLFHLNSFSFFNKRIEVVAHNIYGQASRDWIDIFFINPLQND